jgi:hypothetical protein
VLDGLAFCHKIENQGYFLLAIPLDDPWQKLNKDFFMFLFTLTISNNKHKKRHILCLELG